MKVESHCGCFIFVFIFSLSRARYIETLMPISHLWYPRAYRLYSFIALQLHHTKKTMGDKAKEEFAKVFARLLHSFRAIHSLRLRMLTESRENEIRYLRVRGRHCDTFSSLHDANGFSLFRRCNSFWRNLFLATF